MAFERHAYPESVQRLIDALSSMPGIGKRSAERLAFHLLKSSREEAMKLANAIEDVKTRIGHCSVCWNLSECDPCRICTDQGRDRSRVLVVEQPRDLIALEHTGMYRGGYHVLLGRLDPLSGVGVESLTVDGLLARINDSARNAGGCEVQEVILGLNPDMEGDSTALMLGEKLAATGVVVTRLARGLPSGSQIEYANSAVLAEAIHDRREV